MHRFFLTEKDQIKNSTITLNTLSTFQQIIQVLRFKIGDQLILLPNDGTEILCQLLEINNTNIIAEILEIKKINSEPSRKITLAQSILKNLDRFEYALQKGIELGFTELIPIITHRTERIPKNKDQRWKKIITEASEQSGRTKIPKLQSIQKLQDLNFTNKLIIIPHTSSPLSLSKTYEDLKNIISNDSRDILIIIGPEGGFTEEEVESIPNSIKVSLGPRILRSETAGSVIITLINAIIN